MRQVWREMEAAAERGLLNGDDQFKYFPVVLVAVVVGVRVRLTQQNWQSEQQQRQQPEPRLPAFSS